MSRRRITVALAGNPNVGKTTLFNRLTGGNLKVGNWPGVTVEKMTGRRSYKENELDIVDLPGTYSLTAYAEDELIARNHIIRETPDVLVHVIDPNNLGRNLYLTYQLLELNCRLVLALNMWDLVKSSGTRIDVLKLSKHLGVPVVPLVSSTGEGIEDLLDVIIKESRAPKVCGRAIRYEETIENAITDVIRALEDENGPSIPEPRWTAIKSLEGDEEVIRLLSDLGLKKKVKSAIGNRDPAEMEIALTDSRYNEVDRTLSLVLKKARVQERFPDLIDSVVTNKFLGIPIFLVIIWSIFQLTFEFATPFSDIMDLAIGDLGEVIKDGPGPEWLTSMLGEGVIGGVGAVIIFLPNILVLFFLISILESSGYMARAAFVMDRIMSRIGLSGKSFIPMVIGFGCNVPAIMATRSIDDRKDRLVTILINPFISCGARLPVYVLLIGIFFKGSGGLVLFSLYLLGIGVAILSAKLFRMTILKGDASPFIMELPRFKTPDMKLSLRSTWEKGAQYLKKAGTVILIGSVIMWFLASFSVSLGRVDYGSSSSMAGALGKLIAPLFSPIGFDWKIAVSLLFGLIGKELVVSSFGVLYNVGEDQGALTDKLGAELTSLTGISLMVFVLLYIPCLATIATIKQETGSWGWALLSLLYSTIVAYSIALIIYQGGLLLGL